MQVKTKLHIVAQGIDPRSKRSGASHDVVQGMMKAHSYVIDKDVIALLQRDDVHESINALCVAGIARLPVPDMLVEFDTVGHRVFIHLKEAPNEKIYAYVAVMELKSLVTAVGIDRIVCSITSDGKFTLSMPPVDGEDWDKIIQGAIVVGLSVALLMLNTKGIEKEIVEVHTLNKVRIKKGREPIPSHTVVHIGKIYRRDGTHYTRAEGGWKMPMHIRQAHTRRQHFGPNNEETKIVFVPMCIVNFEPDKPLPQVNRHVKV